MRIFSLFLLALLLAAPASAQLTLSTSGTICPGDSVTASVSGGGAQLLTFLGLGENTGSTTIGAGPSFAVTIDLDSPFVILPIGFTDANGDADLTISIPSSVNTAILPDSLYIQAATMDFTIGMGMPTWTFETSNVENVTGGSSCP